MARTCNNCDARIRTKHRQNADSTVCHRCAVSDENTETETSDDKEGDSEDTEPEHIIREVKEAYESTDEGYKRKYKNNET